MVDTNRSKLLLLSLPPKFLMPRNLVCFLLLFVFATESIAADDSVSPLDTEGRVVRFNRDIAPIFRQRCLECHGREDAKNDFRIDQQDSVMSYVEAGDVEGSSMFVDYMTSDDPDLLMPPPSHGGPLSAGELALVRVWIAEGADWPDDAKIVQVDGEDEGREDAEVTRSIVSPATSSIAFRMWMAQGYLHPATVHFPIALLLLGGGFVVIGWKFPSVGTQIPLACLLIGAASAVAASMMGWAFASVQGYGGWTKLGPSLMDQPGIVLHRWSAVLLTVLSVAFAAIALWSIRTESPRATRIWKLGLLVCAMLVGAVGHQGGELTYGEDLYADMFEWVLGSEKVPQEDVTGTLPEALSGSSADPSKRVDD